MHEVPPATIDWIGRLHDVVDTLVAPIVAAHGPRLTCRSGCHSCCADGLSVFGVEAALIARHHAELLASGVPHAPGGCAFLGAAGECRIYPQRPYVCRTQGLPLRWLERDEEGAAREVRDVCPLNASGSPLETLDAEACWTLGPIEARLAERQSAVDDGAAERVALRSLFAATRRHLPIV